MKKGKPFKTEHVLVQKPSNRVPSLLKQHFLYLSPLPQKHGSLRPILRLTRTLATDALGVAAFTTDPPNSTYRFHARSKSGRYPPDHSPCLRACPLVWRPANTLFKVGDCRVHDPGLVALRTLKEAFGKDTHRTFSSLSPQERKNPQHRTCVRCWGLTLFPVVVTQTIL